MENKNEEMIRKQDAVDLLLIAINDGWSPDYAEYKMKALPPVQPEQKKQCEICEELESGDTLYKYSDWDGGIGFDYVRNIKFCPVCGRRLDNG